MTDTPVGKPNITFGLAHNTFEWPELQLTVQVDRISEEGQAELYFYHTNGNNEILMHLGKANLLSSTFQRDFIKALDTRRKGIDWQTVLTYISRDTIANLRKGEPLIWLNEDYGKTKPEYLLPPLFVKNAANIIYADRSSAKTLFMTLIGLTLTLPWYDNPIGLNIKDTERHIILYCDWEGDAHMTGWQKECLRRGMGIEICDIPYLHCARSLVDDIGHIQKMVQEISADVVILDSLGMAVGDDLNLTKPAFAFYSALRQLPVTPLIVAHTSKDINNKRKTVYGNAYYENEARSVWEVSKQQELGSSELVVTLHHRKSPPFAGYHEPLAWRFNFDIDSTTIETTAPETDKRSSDDTPPSETDIALEIIYESTKPLTAQEILIQSAGKIKATNIYTVLGRIVKKPELEVSKDANNRYYLSTNNN